MSLVDGDKYVHFYGKYICFVQGNVMWTENISPRLFLSIMWLKLKNICGIKTGNVEYN